MPKPYFKFVIGDNDISENILAGNISLSISEGVGENADSASIEIDDPQGIITPPPRDVEMRIFGGYVDDFRDFGIFIVDQTSLEGWPQKVKIGLQSAGAKKAQKQRRQKSYKPPEYSTYKDIFSEISSRNEWQLALSEEIGSKSVEIEVQTEEGDLAFLSRITDKFDAHVSVKNKHLIGVMRGQGKSISGAQLPIIEISSALNIISYSCSDMDKPKHKKTKSTWFDRNKVEMVTEEDEGTEDGPDFLHQVTTKSQLDAKETSKSNGKKLKRGAGSASFVIDGNPHNQAEAIVLVSNVRSLVNGRWRCKKITHNWSSSGPYTNSIECELPS